MVNTILNSILINEASDSIHIDIQALNPTSYVIHSIIIDTADDVTVVNGVLTPSVEPLDNINNSDIIEVDATQQHYIKDWPVPTTNKLIYVFVCYANASTPSVVVPGIYDVFSTYNLYDYINSYMILSKKIGQNNPAPKELIELIINKKTLEYSLVTSNYAKAKELHEKMLTYYD